MAVKTVQIRRGLDMYPVHEVPLKNVVVMRWPDQPVFLPEITQWLQDRGLDSERGSNGWTCFIYESLDHVDFFFADPQHAMLFKLTYL